MKNKRLLLTLLVFPFVLLSCQKTPSQDLEQTIIEDDKVILHTDVQRAFLKGPIGDINLYARGVEELSRPLSPTFTWEEKEAPYTIFFSEQKDFSEVKTFEVEENKISFSNLKINTTYYYKVISNQDIIVNESFATSNEIIRNLYISGVTNARDLGGYVTKDGVTKQGVLFRTGRLNKSDTSDLEVSITSQGIKTMLDDLKVKTEIDLRMVNNDEVGGLKEGYGVLGRTVKYYQCPMEYVNTMDIEGTDDSLRKVFSIHGNKDNYPAFFHCSIGTDRTGYISWLINGMLGVDEEYLWRDYLFSNFGNIGGKRNIGSIENGYISFIKESEGATLQEKTTNFLLNKGVKQKELDVIKEMMLAKDN